MDPRFKPESLYIKLTEENKEYLHDLKIGQSFLRQDVKSDTIKEKFKSVFLLKITLQKGTGMYQMGRTYSPNIYLIRDLYPEFFFKS